MLDHTRTMIYTYVPREGRDTLCIPIPIPVASYRKAEVQNLTLPSKLSGSTGLHWIMAPLK